MRAVLRLGMLVPLLGCGCFSLFTETDGLAGGASRDGGSMGDAAADAAALPPYEKRYTELLGRFVGTPTTPLPMGLSGVGLGVTFPRAGKLAVLFGDNFQQYDDAVAFAPLAYPASGLPALSFFTNGAAVVPLRVASIDLGRGNVPVEGLVVADKSYVFFATSFDAGKGQYGGAALAHTTTDFASLTLDFASTTKRFVHVSVVADGSEAWIFGSGADHRKSAVYLARAPLDAIGDAARWKYYAGGGFVDAEAAATPVVDHACVGELSVRKHPRLGLYVMAYNCTAPRGILVRLASSPTGPWSQWVDVMDSTLADGGYGRTMHATASTADYDDGLSESLARVDEIGGEYGPYLVPEWFDATPTEAGTFAIVYTMSSGNPYTVWLMRTVIGGPGTTATPPKKGEGLPKATIVNGDFATGDTMGWTGAGDSLRVYSGPDGKYRVTSSGTVKGDAAVGSLSQEVTIDASTTRLRFAIHGGDGSVKLMRGNEVLRQSWGRRNNADSNVAWDVSDFRGDKVRIVIEDTLTGVWGFIGATAFTLE